MLRTRVLGRRPVAARASKRATVPNARSLAPPLARPTLEEQRALARNHHRYRARYHVDGCLTRPPHLFDFFSMHFGCKLLGTTPQGNAVLLIRVGWGRGGRARRLSAPHTAPRARLPEQSAVLCLPRGRSALWRAPCRPPIRAAG
jgi:hypothetical protein